MASALVPHQQQHVLEFKNEFPVFELGVTIVVANAVFVGLAFCVFYTCKYLGRTLLWMALAVTGGMLTITLIQLALEWKGSSQTELLNRLQSTFVYQACVQLAKRAAAKLIGWS